MAATKQRKCTAFHEAGHTAAALVFGLPILSVSLDPPRLLRGRLRAPEAAFLCVCASAAALPSGCISAERSASAATSMS
jgi:hypothetical protein